MTSPIVLTPKSSILGRKHVIWAIQRKNQCDGLTWARDREKRQYNKKVTKVLYFPYLGEAPTGPIRPWSCRVDDVRDVITCAKFQIESFMGYDFTSGRIFDFPVDFCMGLTCAACDLEWPCMTKEKIQWYKASRGLSDTAELLDRHKVDTKYFKPLRPRIIMDAGIPTNENP